MNSPTTSNPDTLSRGVVLHPRVVTGSGGGPDKTILNSPRFLKQWNYETHCLYLRPPGDEGFEALRQRADFWNAPLEELDDRGMFDWKIVPQTVSLCQRLGVTIWHGHDYKTNLLGLLVRRKHPMQLVTTVHGWVKHTIKTPLYYAVDRWSIKRYDQVICVSPDLLSRCREFGVSESKSCLIENAIDTDEFSRQTSRADAKQRLGLPVERPLIGAVGRLSQEKGFDQLIRCFAQVQEKHPTASLVIIGDGDQRSVLKQQIAELGLENDVQLAGFQSNTSQWYEAMDIYALSSLREGLPNVILESMAFETPIVATRVAGIPRIMTHEENGLIVDIGDEAAMSRSLARLLSDSTLRHQLGTAGRRTVEERYSFQTRMQKMADLYDRLAHPESGTTA